MTVQPKHVLHDGSGRFKCPACGAAPVEPEADPCPFCDTPLEWNGSALLVAQALASIENRFRYRTFVPRRRQP